MHQNLKHFIKLLVQSIVFWTLAMFCYAVFRYYGLDQEIAIALKKGFDGNDSVVQPLVIFTSIGFGLGILYALIDYLFEKYVPKKIPLGLNILFKTGLYFMVTIFIISVVISIASEILELGIKLYPGWWINDKRFWNALFYMILASFVFSFIKMAIERFGKGVFLKMLIGTYKNPKEEERIFMFLDLKDSTTIAEHLSHRKYSQFIQDCFLDLNEVVLKYEAEIYQYVGDEAVLSWAYKKGLQNNNCIGIFFAFEAQRQSRRTYYIQKYGVYPEFKAGLHGGTLMVAEVGFVKKELAYHGDVINTSARIQAECNTHNVSLLLSEKLLKDLKIGAFMKSKSFGNVLLKGKQKDVKIHTIIQND